MHTEPDPAAPAGRSGATDSAARVAARWAYEREDARTSGRPGQEELVEAAYARPELRCLFPFTSHWTLRFATVAAPERPVIGPEEVSLNTVSVFVTRAGTFAIQEHFMGPVVAEFPTPAAAVAALIDLGTSGRLG